MHVSGALCYPCHSLLAEVIAEVKKNFEQELEIDPRNASAEYVLGDLAKDDGDLSSAIQHFSRATKLDVGFADAYLGLGTALFRTSSSQMPFLRSKLTSSLRPTARPVITNLRLPILELAAKTMRIVKRVCNVKARRPSSRRSVECPRE